MQRKRDKELERDRKFRVVWLIIGYLVVIFVSYYLAHLPNSSCEIWATFDQGVYHTESSTFWSVVVLLIGMIYLFGSGIYADYVSLNKSGQYLHLSENISPEQIYSGYFYSYISANWRVIVVYPILAASIVFIGSSLFCGAGPLG